jgi:hypothetical protein
MVMGIDIAFLIGLLAGIGTCAGAFVLWNVIGPFRIKKQQDVMTFMPSNNPPDEGIQQRIYKPEGTPAEISRNAIVRNNTPRKK